jgi:hypothetical protein
MTTISRRVERLCSNAGAANPAGLPNDEKPKTAPEVTYPDMTLIPIRVTEGNGVPQLWKLRRTGRQGR